ncbi:MULTISPECIES: hypothetical protein [Deinococcus]|nr:MULTISPECIES: hypothetical protein [Deinococcus]
MGQREHFLVIIDTLGERMRLLNTDVLERFQALGAQFRDKL